MAKENRSPCWISGWSRAPFLREMNCEHRQISEAFRCGSSWSRYRLAAVRSSMASGPVSPSCGNIEPAKTNPNNRFEHYCDLDLLALVVLEDHKIMVEKRPALHHRALSICETSHLRRSGAAVRLRTGFDPQFMDSVSFPHTFVFHLVRACSQGRNDDGSRLRRRV